MFEELIRFIRDLYGTDQPIPLHVPTFSGREMAYVDETISTGIVSSVGQFVERFERDIALYTGVPRAVAAVNGTAALHLALMLAGVSRGDLVLTQALTFVATCNAISYCGATPVFVDVDIRTMGMSPAALAEWLDEFAKLGDDGICRFGDRGARIRACVPMHTFGHPAKIDAISEICKRWHIELVEDAAESLGSFYRGRHTGTFGRLGVLSFNGNKIVTTGGGGMLLGDEQLGAHAKHLSTTAKKPHPYEYVHDEIGYNYRLPNLNAALGCAQMERIEQLVEIKRDLARRYEEHLRGGPFGFVSEPDDCRSNYWLNAVVCQDREQRDALLTETNRQGVLTRPIWRLMNRLPMFERCTRGPLPNSEWLEDRIVNLPSSVPRDTREA